MKKSFLASILVTTMLSTTAMADVALHGQVEESVSTTNGVSDLVGDNFVGVTVNEDLGKGMTAFGKIEFTVDGDSSSNADAVTNREVYAGIDFGAVSVSAGKMPNLRKSMAQPGYFKGNGLFVTGQDRADDTVKVEAEFGKVKVAATTVLDGTTNADTVGETRELGASIDLGIVSLSAVQSKAGSADATVIYGAKANVSGVKLAVAYEPDATNVTTTALASYDIGNNTIMVGNKFVNGADDTMILEGVHNFSKNVYTFANYKKPENGDATTMIGVGIKF